MDTNEKFSDPSAIHIPIALVSLALCFLFLLQIRAAGQASKNMKWQMESAEKQLLAQRTNFDQLTKAIAERKAQGGAVWGAEQTQKLFADIMREVDQLARDKDKDAEEINLLIASAGLKLPENAAQPEKKPDPTKPEEKK